MRRQRSGSVWRDGAVVLGVCAVLALAPAARAAGAAPDSLTAAQCAALARRHALEVHAAARDVDVASLDSLTADADRDPNFAFDAGLWVAPDGAYDPAFTNLGEYHAQFGATWTLSDGGRRARERSRTSLGAASARARHALAVRDAGESAAALALHELRLREQARVLADAGDGLARIGALVGAGVRSGLRSPADSIRLALAREDAALDDESASSEIESTHLDLLAILGRALDAELALRPTPDAGAAEPGVADSAAVLARVAGRAEVVLAKLETQVAQLEIIEAARRDAPELGLALDAGFAGTDLAHLVPPALADVQPGATFGDRLRRDLGASLALTLHAPFWDGTRAPARAARTAALAAARERLAGEQRRQEREARALLARWRTASARARMTGTIVARAETHFLRTKSLYAGGATTLFDVLDALQLLKDARLRQAEAGEDLRMVHFLIEDRP